MANSYDLIVIGTGTAASVAAHQCRQAGWRVAVADHLPFGGTCALRGCDPKKILVRAAESVDHVRRMRGKGVVLLAVGAVPMRLGIPGEELLITSTEFLELEQLPKRIVLLGGGYIAAEFAHIAARAGADVTILEQMERMLTPFDPDLVSWLMEKFREVGVDLRLNTRVTGLAKRGSSFLVRARANGQEQAIAADLVVHATGRVPDLDPLDLPAAGVETSRGRLKLNEYLQSETNPAVYAAGDAAGNGPPLTPVAARDGHVAAANMLGGNHQKPNYRGVASVAFTIPPIASVGMSEKQARERDRSPGAQGERLRLVYRAQRRRKHLWIQGADRKRH
jgi:glutathione reductase (NADPH)